MLMIKMEASCHLRQLLLSHLACEPDQVLDDTMSRTHYNEGVLKFTDTKH